MATFTTIADTVLEPGKPIRSIDILALRDNILAVPGGAAGAPRIAAAALQTGNNERDWVLARTSGAAVGAVGTYGLLRAQTAVTRSVGATLAGSSLWWASVNSGRDGSSPSGTWRLLGVTGRLIDGSASTGDATQTSVWLRIS